MVAGAYELLKAATHNYVADCTNGPYIYDGVIFISLQYSVLCYNDYVTHHYSIYISHVNEMQAR